MLAFSAFSCITGLPSFALNLPVGSSDVISRAATESYIQSRPNLRFALLCLKLITLFLATKSSYAMFNFLRRKSSSASFDSGFNSAATNSALASRRLKNRLVDSFALSVKSCSMTSENWSLFFMRSVSPSIASIPTGMSSMCEGVSSNDPLVGGASSFRLDNPSR